MANAGGDPVVALLARLAATRGPVLTWYSRAGERIELTGPVLVQWVAKVSHLLLDLGAEPGERVLVDLGADWRAPLVWLAVWWDGLTLVTAPADPATRAEYAVVREDRLDPTVSAAVPADGLVVVARAALATRVTQLPPGATDFATVRAFPDQAPPPAEDAGVAVELGHVIDSAPPVGRLLLGPDAAPGALATVWAGGGSVVWHDGLNPEALARVGTSEGLG